MLKIICIGKKHEKWIEDAILRYEKRLNKPFNLQWQILPHSAFQNVAARGDESNRILAKIDQRDFVILLDETGQNIDSPRFSKLLQDNFLASRPIVLVIGGAYGVDQNLKTRADFIWSLSRLVFPHMLVRLILAEQIYRAQEIAAGSRYHHL